MRDPVPRFPFPSLPDPSWRNPVTPRNGLSLHFPERTPYGSIPSVGRSPDKQCAYPEMTHRVAASPERFQLTCVNEANSHEHNDPRSHVLGMDCFLSIR